MWKSHRIGRRTAKDDPGADARNEDCRRAIADPRSWMNVFVDLLLFIVSIFASLQAYSKSFSTRTDFDCGQ